MDSWLGIVVGSAASGIGAYLAIRIEIALLKQRQDRADADRREYREEMRMLLDKLGNRIDEAHDRINSLQRKRTDTL